MLAYNPENMTEDEREYLLSMVGQAHASLSEVALKLRLGLPPKTPGLKTAINAERVVFDLVDDHETREFQRQPGACRRTWLAFASVTPRM